eukprot:352133-Chlamydomonas_euryale.AAC.2
MVVEVLLQLLVREVDAQLLKVVRLEALKAVDVEHANARGAVGVLPNRRVDARYQPVKKLGVHNLGERVAVGGRRSDIKRRDDRSIGRLARACRKRLAQTLRVDAQQVGCAASALVQWVV